jgi:glycine betaine/proline transport system substrate-binding protein
MGVMRRTRMVAGVAALALVAAACSRGGSGGSASAAPSTAASGGGTGQTVNVAINPWVGYEANAAVVDTLLRDKLGFKVEEKDLTEQVSWEGFQSGQVDAILENWGHQDLAKTYITDKKVAVDAGSTGIDGIIGWYVPPWMVTKYPDITDWNNLNKYADLFKTSESGGKGQLLDGDPSFVTSDEGIINGLNLNYKVVYAGSEAALIEAFRKAEQNKTPLIGYFYSPQWFLSEVKLVHVNLPPWKEGCDKDPTKITCDYAPYKPLNKVVSQRLVDGASKAYQLIKNFQWTEADQNTVSDYIANKKMSRADAGKKWVADNEAKWKAWIPS